MSDADRLRWDARYEDPTRAPGLPPKWLLEAPLPRQGRALDLASGLGRCALHLAQLGLDVLAVDVSAVALGRLDALNLPRLRTQAVDLELDSLPEGPFDVITCFAYRQPSLWPLLPTLLAPGGLLVMEVFHVSNLALSPHPSRRFLAESGELLAAAEGLEILAFREGEGTARLLARR